MNPPRHREDPYFWLRSDDRKDEQVLAHLRKENAYGKSQFFRFFSFFFFQESVSLSAPLSLCVCV